MIKKIKLRAYFGFLSALTIVFAAVHLSSCGSSSSPSNFSSAPAAMSAIETNLAYYTPSTKDVNISAFNFRPALDKLAAFFTLPAAFAGSQTALNSVWTQAGTMNDPYPTVVSQETLQGYLGQMVDPAFRNQNSGAAVGAAGRYMNAMFQACLTVALSTQATGTDTDGLAKVGTGTATLNFASVPTSGTFMGCTVPAGGIGVSNGSMTITLTVEAVTGNSSYTKKMTATGAPGGGGTVYLKLDSSNGIFNMENISPSDNPASNAACGGSRFIIALTNSLTQLEYEDVSLSTSLGGGACSNSNSQWQLYRVHIDQGSSNAAYILGMNGQSVSGAGDGTAFLLAGQPNKISAGSASIAVSVWNGAGGSTKIPSSSTAFLDSSVDGCVTASTGATSTSTATLACDLTGIDVQTAQSMLSSTFTSHVTASPPTSTVGTPSAIAWTGATDFATAATSP